MDAIMLRRSTRKFLETPVEKEKLERILRAAMQSPTGHNAQEWEFLVVREKETLLKISRASVETSAAKNAPMALVLLANMERAAATAPMIWAADLAAAAQTILIQAEEEGLGAVWLSCWPYETKMACLRELLALPAHIVPYCVVPIGYKAKVKPFEDRYDPGKIHYDSYTTR